MLCTSRWIKQPITKTFVLMSKNFCIDVPNFRFHLLLKYDKLNKKTRSVCRRKTSHCDPKKRDHTIKGIERILDIGDPTF